MGASGSAWHLALVWSPAPTYEHSSFPREGFGSDNPKKKKKKKSCRSVVITRTVVGGGLLSLQEEMDLSSRS